MWTTRVSNPVCSPHFRASASVASQSPAFAIGVLRDIYAFHRYTTHSSDLGRTQVKQYQTAVLQLSRRISPLTYLTAYAPFKPNKSGQRLHPPYYRGCWHGVSRCLFCGYPSCTYSAGLSPAKRGLQSRGPSSLTRHGWIRVPPIVQYSLLLPPVGVWAVSQSQCG